MGLAYLISYVVWMDSNGCISKHRFRTRCSNDNFLVWMDDVITHQMTEHEVDSPEPSIGYENDVITPNSNFSFAS